MYVPNLLKVKLLILDEIHKTPYSGHPGVVAATISQNSKIF